MHPRACHLMSLAFLFWSPPFRRFSTTVVPCSHRPSSPLSVIVVLPFSSSSGRPVRAFVFLSLSPSPHSPLFSQGAAKPPFSPRTLASFSVVVAAAQTFTVSSRFHFRRRPLLPRCRPPCAKPPPVPPLFSPCSFSILSLSLTCGPLC